MEHRIEPDQAETTPGRRCRDCPADISHRAPGTVRCHDCALTRERTRAAERQEEGASSAARDRRCEDCNILINDRGSRAVYCRDCADNREKRRKKV